MSQNRFTRRNFILKTAAGTAFLPLSKIISAKLQTKERPNILWITSEDNSPFLGCYGDSFATTPNLDRLSEEGILYENAFANAPVCAPARFTILTGMYACSTGTHQMRSRYPIPAFIKPYPIFLQEAGYYCTNRSKTDYNFDGNDKSYWNECDQEATFKNRKPGQPFFAVINIGISHESSIHKSLAITKHSQKTVPLPPYHPDTAEIRHDWAQYYDQVEKMDMEVGKILDDLKKDGLDEETIVFYYADHGGVLCRSKRFLYDTGTHVPLIIRFPKKYQYLAPGIPGTRTNRLVSFVDLAPTLLSLAGIKIPDYMQGKAFLGDQQSTPREYVHLFRGRMDERFDLMRAIRDKKFKYIRNYMPHRIYGQHLEYLWRAPATRSWQKEYEEGRCNDIQSIFWGTKLPEELYDISSDPWEVNNLATNPQYKKTLQRMRQENINWLHEINDTGFIPESEIMSVQEDNTIYDLFHNNVYSVDRIIETAEMATFNVDKYLPELKKRLQDPEAAVRFWAATGCIVLGEKALSAETNLLVLLDDKSPDVRITAAEALCMMNNTDIAISTIISELNNQNSMTALFAANSLDALDWRIIPYLEKIKKVNINSDDYLKRALNHTVCRLKINKSGF